MTCQLAHLLRYTRQDVHITLTCPSAILLQFIVNKEVIEVVGKVKIILINGQFGTETKCIFC